MMHLGDEICRKEEKVCEDRISALPDDLLVHILSEMPIKDVVITMVLSKRWRSLWTMVYNLEYEDTDIDEKSVWDFLDKSLQLHKAQVLEYLSIELGRNCPVDADVGKCVSHAVDRSVRELNLVVDFLETVDPISLPKNLYTCKTLVYLTLSNKILIDVPSSVCLPSLRSLDLIDVVYKDVDTHVRLLSSCPILKYLVVVRNSDDNVTWFSVKVPSLETLTYTNMMCMLSGYDRNLVIDCPRLYYIKFDDPLGDNCLFKYMPQLDVAIVDVGCCHSHPNKKFLTAFSFVMFLDLASTDIAFCTGINFSWLIELKLCPDPDYTDIHWLESLTLLLLYSPKLRVLMINPSCTAPDYQLSWNLPSSVPVCLLSNLEIFEWETYRGGREEKRFLAYVLANSKCLKTVGISPRPFNKVDENILEKEQKMKEELESMYRVSASSQLIFSVQLRWRSYRE